MTGKGIWTDQVLPRATDRLLGTAGLRHLRREAVAGSHGCVVEVGFGSGLNLEHYPPEVRRVLAVEPSSVAVRLAAPRIDATGVPVEMVGLDAQDLPIASSSADVAVSTFTLCCVPDPVRALDELARVLRPGGTLHFLEHGRSPVPAVAAWQRRLTPLQRRLAAGCHLDRPIAQLIAEAGFALEVLRNHEVSPLLPMRPFGHLYLGVATKGGARQDSAGPTGMETA